MAQLISTNVSGNLHEVCRYVNEMWLGDFVVAMSCTGYNTIVVFKVPDKLAPQVRLCLAYREEARPNPPVIPVFKSIKGKRE